MELLYSYCSIHNQLFNSKTIDMIINKANTFTPRTLLSVLSQREIKYGDKFQHFSSLVAQKFDRMIIINFKRRLQKEAYNTILPNVVFLAIMLKKIQKTWQEPEFDRVGFLKDIRYKQDQILNKNKEWLIGDDVKRFFNTIMNVLSEPRTIYSLYERNYQYIYQLINMCCQKKVKNFEQIQHYKFEQMTQIGNVFKEKIYLINYDEEKDAIQKVPIDHKAIYVLKAKDQYFFLIKFQEITPGKQGRINHEELANIFRIQHKLAQESPKKGSESPKKVEGSPKKEQSLQAKHNSSMNESNMPNPPIMSRLKSSNLFPQQVKCKVCCKKISQFNALHWNYQSYCIQCVVNPKVDVSCVPASVILKYLKSVGYQNNSPYHVICPECQTDGTIKNYRVEDKVREYRCNACSKTICIEHQQIIVECFCYCIRCQKQTITIQSLYKKYCNSCRTRKCELCNKTGKVECNCICKKCGEVNLVDHECNGQCHNCKGTNMTLMACNCNHRLCPMCYFRSLEPSEQICTK